MHFCGVENEINFHLRGFRFIAQHQLAIEVIC